MATQHTKRIGNRPKEKPVSRIDTLQDTWRVMKPFVHFSVKAMKLLAHALIYIVKHVPKPEEKAAKDKIIKI